MHISHINGPGIDELLAMERGGGVYYYHADGLGSVVALTDASEATVESYTYTSFGDVERTGSVGNRFTFTGREWDTETGLYYYRARYYDPEAGRFINKDPIGFAGGDTNLYGYVLADPVNWVDPWGLVTWPASGVITSGYGSRRNPTSSAIEEHLAIDISNPIGGAVVASDTGVVVRVRQGINGEANSVTIQHADGTVAAYSHITSNLRVGEKVIEGVVIGYTDLSGRSTGGHLHYGYYVPGIQGGVDPIPHFIDANPYPGGKQCR